MNAEKEFNFISVVVYIRNDSSYLKTFFSRLLPLLQSHFREYEVICVDDESSDDSCDVIRNIEKLNDNVSFSILHMSYFQGVEISMTAGAELAIGDYIFEFDSVECDYDPELILEVYDRVLEGNDIVSAVPDRKARFSSSIFYKIFNSYAARGQTIATNRFSIITRRAYNRIISTTKTIPYRKAIYAKSGLNCVSINYHSAGTEYIQDSSSAKRRDLAIDSLILFTPFAYRFSLLLAFLMAILAGLTIVYTLIIFLKGYR